MAAQEKKTMKVCIFGESCYRQNPIHFGEYSHPHLEEIYKKGRDPETNEYTIPDELFMSAEIIQNQLKLYENLFPKKQTEQPKKTLKERVSKNNEEEDCVIERKEIVSNKGRTESGNKQPNTDNHTFGGSDSKTSVGYRLGSSSSEPTKTVAIACQFGSEKRANMPSTSRGAACSNASSNLAKKQKITRDIKDYIPVVVEKGRMAAKLEAAAPYNMFLTAITDSKQTHNEPLTITMQEILDESLGAIESSVQINFMVDIGWLLGHYYFAGILRTELLVLYGDETPEIKTISSHQPQVTSIKVNMPTPFSTSHAKVMLFGYKDGSMRVVISTANLYEDDWHNRTQGIWISPKLPALPENADTAAGESPTNFKQDLMLYLVEYKISKLQPWIARIRKSDFSAINVFFIGSVPGGFREGQRGFPWGHARLGGLLHQHCTPIDDKIPIVCQSSSIGSLGTNVQPWIQHNLLNSLRKDSNRRGLRQFPPFKMIYPSFGNVKNSHDDLLGGGCLPYSKSVNDKQPWLKTYLHQWCSSTRHRSRAMPHIKSYTRFSLTERCVYWFVLTSANLSKAAWGSFNAATNIQPCLRISNYEAGVLFLPKFVTGEETFPLGNERNDIPAFPLPYDVPLKPYGPDDTPFLMDYLH